jgi:hypothetical protein
LFAESLTGCSPPDAAEISANSVGHIAADELREVEAQALAGDKKAIVRLVKYHDFGKPDAGSAQDPDLYRWSKVAVSFGMSEYSLFALQTASERVADCDDVLEYAREQTEEDLAMVRQENRFVDKCLASQAL